jgi:glycosyltransferase involved in cell wall biosynthesis
VSALRILLVGDYPADPRLGSPKVLFKLSSELDALGHDVSMLLRPDLGAHPAQRHARDAASPVLAARAAAAAARAGGAFDVIDASSAEGLILALRRTVARAVVARSHGLEHRNYARMLADARAGTAPRPLHRRLWYPAVRMRLVAWSARAADRLIVANEADRAFAIERGWKREDEIDVVPHGLAPVFLAPVAPEPRADDLLFCGSWDRVKGIDDLARAFELTVERRPATRLTILGPGCQPEAVLSSFAAPVRGNIAVHDRVAEDVVAWFYRRHKALVMCSTFEGYGMVVPEAMSQRLPIVATPVGVVPTVIRDGESGLLVPPRDPAALSAAMLRLLDDPPLRERLAEAAVARVQGMTWAAAARRTVTAYERALASRGTGARRGRV